MEKEKEIFNQTMCTKPYIRITKTERDEKSGVTIYFLENALNMIEIILKDFPEIHHYINILFYFYFHVFWEIIKIMLPKKEIVAIVKLNLMLKNMKKKMGKTILKLAILVLILK